MDRQVYIGEGGKIVTRKDWKRFWRYFIWVALQIVWNLGCLFWNLVFHFKPFWTVETIQWTGVLLLWYFQFKTANLRGVVIPCVPIACKKWNVLFPESSGFFLLIYKVEPQPEGWVDLYCWTCRSSKWQAVNWGHIAIVKIGVAIRIIK
jgi:hypothetical protein